MFTPTKGLKPRTFSRCGIAALLLTAPLLSYAAPRQQEVSGSEVVSRGVKSSAVILGVGNLHDLGGAGLKGPDGKALTDRLENALRKFVAEEAPRSNGRIFAAGSGEAIRGASRLIIEGDVSRPEMANGDSSYLVVLRVYRDEKPRKLVAQFAGTAASLRHLTDNFDRQPGISSYGLLGELTRRIVENASVTGKEGWEDLVKSATSARRVTVDLLEAYNNSQKPRLSVLPGEEFRLRVSSQDVGEAYLVALDGRSKPTLPFAQPEGTDVAPNYPALLPLDSTLTAPRVKSLTTVEYVVLVRRRRSDENGNGKTLRDIPATGEGTNAVSFTTRGGQDDNCEWPQAPKPIQILGSITPEEQDEGIAALVERYQGDPAGSWVGTRVKINVTPFN
jgi:hypothetical protein